ncbi:4-aminobutyrate aminotransferase [Solibacillus sp. FSL W7-1324]|uniref:4-aminobutyrate aminotransferase n=1 Tax=Solibacillus sp. FSL W7-1324 TaxID=2921701 RepID=UPI0030FB8BA0
MDEIIGYSAVGIIIAGLLYALLKQIKDTKHSGNDVGSPLFRKQVTRKNNVMTAALFGILVFFTLNIVSGLNIASTRLNSFTGLGTMISFLVYLYAKFVMKPQQVEQCRKLYN